MDSTQSKSSDQSSTTHMPPLSQSYGTNFYGGDNMLFEKNRAINLAYSLSLGLSYGGGISFYNARAIFGSNISFVDNFAQYASGGLGVVRSKVTMGNDLTFIRNRAIGW